MTDLEAMAIVRARWAHPPIDLRDVEERLALRLVDRDEPPVTRVIACPPACRLFVLRGVDEDGRERWCSRYVHTAREVDGALDWIAARLCAREAAAT